MVKKHATGHNWRSGRVTYLQALVLSTSLEHTPYSKCPRFFGYDVDPLLKKELFQKKQNTLEKSGYLE